jgi:hypothetical protein
LRGKKEISSPLFFQIRPPPYPPSPEQPKSLVLPLSDSFILPYTVSIAENKKALLLSNDKSNAAESFWKKGCGEENLFSKRFLPRKTLL